MIPTSVPALRVSGVVKDFGRTRALDGVDFELLPGEIHALLGENGAGKSTLINVLRGHIRPTSGETIVRGETVRISSPSKASDLGIGMVHQHFLLVPVLSVIDNLSLATRSRSILINRAAVASKASAIATRLGWNIPLDAIVADLPVGTQQRVEIVKALLGDATILLFDEPTAVLAPSEIGELFDVLRQLRASGCSIVFVSHKLTEVMDLCDRVTVLRRGREVGTVAIGDTSPADLASRMVGGNASVVDGQQGAATSPCRTIGPVVAEIVNLSTRKSRLDEVALDAISLQVREGEVLGIAGVDGNGQTELFEALAGLRPYTAAVRKLPSGSTDRLNADVAFIPPDRHRQGLALSLSVADNLTLDAANLPGFRRGPFLHRQRLSELAQRLTKQFDVRAADLSQPVRALSGGNQQKVVIARALWRSPRLLIAVSPTRGLDVSATAYVHEQLRAARSSGTAVLLISTELDEIIALSDRIGVLYEGRIVDTVQAGTTRDRIGLLMGGRAATSPRS